MTSLTQDATAGLGSLQQLYDGALFPDVQVRTLRNVDWLLPTRTIECGTRSRPLLSGEALQNFAIPSKGVRFDLHDYLALNRVGGLLAMKNGVVRLEAYELGNTPSTRWMSMSIAKSVTATLVGVALKAGLIGSLDDAVISYVPALAGSAYDGVSIRNVLQMASGVAWNEEYLDPHSDRRRMLDIQSSQTPGALIALLSKLPRAAAPGTRWNYSTGETHVLGAVLRAAVGRPLAQYLSEQIWVPCSMESAATWWLESPGGLEVGGSGISATLRDYGRLGQFMLDGRSADGEALLADTWLKDASTPKSIGGFEVPYGYMFWTIPHLAEDGRPAGAFEARGIFGQHIYVNPAEKIIVVVWSALPKPKNMETIVSEDFFLALVAALRKGCSA